MRDQLIIFLYRMLSEAQKHTVLHIGAGTIFPQGGQAQPFPAGVWGLCKPPSGVRAEPRRQMHFGNNQVSGPPYTPLILNRKVPVIFVIFVKLVTYDLHSLLLPVEFLR